MYDEDQSIGEKEQIAEERQALADDDSWDRSFSIFHTAPSDPLASLWAQVGNNEEHQFSHRKVLATTNALAAVDRKAVLRDSQTAAAAAKTDCGVMGLGCVVNAVSNVRNSALDAVNKGWQASGGAVVNGVAKDPGWLVAAAVVVGGCAAAVALVVTSEVCAGIVAGAAGYMTANGVTNELDGKGLTHLEDGLNPLDMITSEVAGGVTGGLASEGMSLPALLLHRAVGGAVVGGLSDAVSQGAGGRSNPNELFGSIGFGAIATAPPIPALPSFLMGLATAAGQGWATWIGPH
jgi:hypothetical protein